MEFVEEAEAKPLDLFSLKEGLPSLSEIHFPILYQVLPHTFLYLEIQKTLVSQLRFHCLKFHCAPFCDFKSLHS